MREPSFPSSVSGCLDDGALYRAACGCLLPEEEAQALAHIDRCEACRDAIKGFEEAEGAVRELVRLSADTSSHTASREERPARFAQRLHERKQAEIHRESRRPAIARWLPVAAMFPLLLATLLVSRTHSVVLRADALIERVVTESHTQPAGMVQRVRIQLRPPSTNAPADWHSASGVSPRQALANMESVSVEREVVDGFALVPGTQPPSASSAPPGPLARVLDLQPVDWQRPLSVEGLRSWRQRLTNKRDEIAYGKDGKDTVTLRTTTTQGVLRDVTVVVELRSYRVIKQSLVFEGLGRVEIEELAQRRRAIEPTRPAQVATAAPAAGDAAEPSTNEDELNLAELDARLVLRDADLDLRGDVHVSRQHDLVRVETGVTSAAVRRDVSARLTALSHVRASLRLAPDTLSAPADGTRPALAGWVSRKFEEARPRSTFVPELTRRTMTVSRRLLALHELAQRYPAAEVAHLSADARARLHDLVNRHYAALTADLEALEPPVSVLAGSQPEGLCNAATAAPADWTRRAATGLTQARELERVVQELLTHDDLPETRTGRDGRDELSSTFGALWDTINLPRPASS